MGGWVSGSNVKYKTNKNGAPIGFEELWSMQQDWIATRHKHMCVGVCVCVCVCALCSYQMQVSTSNEIALMI